MYTYDYLAVAVLARLGLSRHVAWGSNMKRRKLPWAQPQQHSDAGVGAALVGPVARHDRAAPSQHVQDAAVPQVMALDSDGEVAPSAVSGARMSDAQPEDCYPTSLRPLALRSKRTEHTAATLQVAPVRSAKGDGLANWATLAIVFGAMAVPGRAQLAGHTVRHRCFY